jgi:hypothetical protein
MGPLLLVVLSLEAIPIGILLSATWDRSLRRRPRFWVRFGALAACAAFPELTLIADYPAGLIGEHASVAVLWGGLAWGLAAVALAPKLLFNGPSRNPGAIDDEGDGPDPGQDPPPPPIGVAPLPDAEQVPVRTRGPHRPRRAPNRRRPAPEPGRAAPRVSAQR